MKKYIVPILIIILGGWLVRIENSILTGSAQDLLVVLTIAFLMFGLGVSLQPKRKNRTWVKKLFISFIFLFLVIWDLGYIQVPALNSVFDILCLNHQFVLYMFYLFLGWLFFD